MAVLAPVPPAPKRLVYLGTPDAAVAPLRALVTGGWEVGLVVTRPDVRRSRGTATSPSPVKATATELGLPVTHRVDDVVDTGADLGVVVAYGRLIPRAILELVPMVNVHFSLLPRWRGAAPVERAILAGDEHTGVGIMQLEEGLDTGPVFALQPVPVGPRITAEELREELVMVGTELLLRTLRDGLHEPEPQEGEPTYAAKLSPAELQLHWDQPAIVLDRVVRVGGAWTTFRGRRLKVLSADPVEGSRQPGVLDGVAVGTGDGALRLVTVQPEGKAPMPAAAWVNGLRFEVGERLGS